MLAMALSGESFVQSERAKLVPVLRFLWETYRAVLDVARQHSKLERLYQRTAREGITSCFLRTQRVTLVLLFLFRCPE
jgi:translation initiation factor 3 subunit A